MNEKMEAFQKKFDEIIADCSKLCFMTPNKELQIEAVETLEGLKTEASQLKQEIISQKDENLANTMLSLEEIITAVISELKMWVSLKDDDASNAWEYLVSAQSAIRSAMQAHPIANKLDNQVQRLYLLEQLLFPPQTFASIGAVIDPTDCECSICGQVYGECDHIKGRAYMGEWCSRVIKHIKKLNEISIVTNPASKHHRIYSVGNTDTLTYRVTSSKTKDKQ